MYCVRAGTKNTVLGYTVTCESLRWIFYHTHAALPIFCHLNSCTAFWKGRLRSNTFQLTSEAAFGSAVLTLSFRNWKLCQASLGIKLCYKVMEKDHAYLVTVVFSLNDQNHLEWAMDYKPKYLKLWTSSATPELYYQSNQLSYLCFSFLLYTKGLVTFIHSFRWLLTENCSVLGTRCCGNSHELGKQTLLLPSWISQDLI